MKNRIKLLLAALMSLALLSGCAGNTADQPHIPQESQVSQESQDSHDSRDSASESSSAGSQDEQGNAPDTSEQSEITVQETSEQSSPTAEQHPATEQPPELPSEEETAEATVTEVISSEQAPPPVSQTTSTTATTSATPTTSTTPSTPAYTEPDPVEVVIPEVKAPLSPGVNTASNDKVTVDYSNAAEGYISVCWRESGKRVKVRITCGDKVYDHDAAEGGVTEYFPLSCGSGSYKVQIFENLEGIRYTNVLEQEFSAEISETSPYLYPNKYVYYTQSSAAVEKAAVLCAGKSGTIEKTAAVFKWITDNVTYDKQLAATVQSGYVPDPDSVLKKKTGICYDYSSLLAAMLRSQGIPVRLVVGYAADSIYHAWNEIWTEENGWITPELLLSKHGFNITDATFYAGANDKNKIAEYISDSGNYSALYYY